MEYPEFPEVTITQEDWTCAKQVAQQLTDAVIGIFLEDQKVFQRMGLKAFAGTRIKQIAQPVMTNVGIVSTVTPASQIQHIPIEGYSLGILVALAHILAARDQHIVIVADNNLSCDQPGVTPEKVIRGITVLQKIGLILQSYGLQGFYHPILWTSSKLDELDLDERERTTKLRIVAGLKAHTSLHEAIVCMVGECES